LTPDLEFYYRKQSLKGDAAVAVCDLSVGKDLQWKDIISHLDTVYLHNVNPSTLIAALKQVRQSMNESVAQYAARFNQIHRRLINLGVSNRDVAAQWFAEGLTPVLRSKVNDKIMEDQVLMKLDKSDAIGAIACVTNIAMAKELNRGFNGRRDDARRDDTGERVNFGRTRSWRDYRQARTNSNVAQLNSIATDFAAMLGVSDADVQRRLKNKECLTCGSNAHHIRDCPKIPRAKANVMKTEEPVESEHPKNE
jgi:hypothetical protein